MAKSFLTNCCVCGKTTSKAYARKHGGQCKPCVTGEPRPESNESRQGRLIDLGWEAYAREEGYYDSTY